MAVFSKPSDTGSSHRTATASPPSSRTCLANHGVDGLGDRLRGNAILCSAAIWVGRRIASPGMLLEAEPLPHLICSRPMFIGGVKDEADQHGGTRRGGGSNIRAGFAGGPGGAGAEPRRGYSELPVFP